MRRQHISYKRFVRRMRYETAFEVFLGEIDDVHAKWLLGLDEVMTVDEKRSIKPFLIFMDTLSKSR